MTENFDHLIHHDIIDRAQQRASDATARLAAAETDLQSARTAHRAAVRATETAAEGSGDISPLDAEKGLHDAALALAAAERVHERAAASHTHATNLLIPARGVAHLGVYLEGARRRIAAAKRGDAARAELAAAEKDYRAAETVIDAAVAGGFPRLGTNAHALPAVPTEADEVFWWKAIGVDLEAGTTPWHPGEY